MADILIACEYSAEVRDAFADYGHNAISFDLINSDRPGPHITDDVLDYLYPPYKWDMLIAFPPCTYICRSGIHWNKKRPERQELTEHALEFVGKLLDAPIHRICLENPVGLISTRIRKPDQIVQPWWFGDPYTKATCLWLKNLPLLEPTNPVMPIRNAITRVSPGPDRWKIRSATPRGMAMAMAAKWAPIL